MRYYSALSILVAVLVALRIAQRVLARRRRAAAIPSGGHRCPSCTAARLVAADSITLPGDAALSAIDLETLACRRCDLRAVGVRAPGTHRAYPVEAIAWGRLSAAIRGCPAPGDRGCTCEAHVRYGRQEEGSWRGLDEVPHDESGMFIVT